jgi:hypothetical protein
MAVSRILLSLLVVVVPGCATNAVVEGPAEPQVEQLPNDAEVIGSVLRYFAASEDAGLTHRERVFIVYPHSKLASFESVDWTVATLKKCGDLSGFRESWHARANGIFDLAGVLPNSTVWRIASPKELGLGMSGLYQRKIATGVQVFAPAYDASGTSAAVPVSFLWSVHMAYGVFIATQKDGAWRVSCSDVFYAL